MQNNQLKSSEIYRYIRDKEGFNASEKTFASNSRFEENEISSCETSIEINEDLGLVDDHKSSGAKPLKIPYFVQKDNIIITTPAHDSGNDNIATEAQKIDAVLEQFKDKLVNGAKILVPICQ